MPDHPRSVGRPVRPLSKADFAELAEFRHQMRRFERVSETIVRNEGMTPLQYQLLLQIKGFPGRQLATISELAERLQAHHHSVVALVTRCEQRGLVARHPSDRDRRQVEVALLPEGENCLQRLAGLHRTELAIMRGKFHIPAFNEHREEQA